MSDIEVSEISDSEFCDPEDLDDWCHYKEFEINGYSMA